MANNTSEVIKNNSCSSNINQDIKQYLLTQKVDEVTESEMKKIEVQKMEDDMTIKMLELEYSEKKRNFIYTTRKLQELQKKISIQTEMIDKLLHVNKAIVEKFHELKRFQNDIILININNAEKTFLTCKNENVKLSKTFQIIIEKENYNESLNKHILDKKYHLNKDIQRQIEQKKKENDNRNKVLSQRTLNIENLKIRLNKEKVGNNLKSLVEEKNKRIIQLEADGEVLQKQIKQEMESLIQDKNNQIHELDNNSYKLLEEKNILISKLQTDLLRMENDIIERRTTLTKVEMEREQIRKEVSKKREINELSESALNESVRNINNEQNKINIELENAKITFLKNETNWHAEMNTLFSKVEERKKLFEKLNGYQKELTKLKEASREASLQKQKEIISDKEFQPTIKKLNEQFKKYEQTISTTIKKQHEFNIKIKELLEKRSAVKQKLDSSDLNEVDTNKNLNSFHDCTTKNPYSYIQDIQSTSLQSKAIELTEDIEKLKSSQEKLSNQLSLEKAKPPSTPTKKSIYSFSIDDSDESDDEFKVQNLTPNKYSGLSTTPKKSVYNVEKEDEINKNEDIFKIPHAYATPIRKKTTVPRKY